MKGSDGMKAVYSPAENASHGYVPQGALLPKHGIGATVFSALTISKLISKHLAENILFNPCLLFYLIQQLHKDLCTLA